MYKRFYIYTQLQAPGQGFSQIPIRIDKDQSCKWTSNDQTKIENTNSNSLERSLEIQENGYTRLKTGSISISTQKLRLKQTNFSSPLGKRNKKPIFKIIIQKKINPIELKDVSISEENRKDFSQKIKGK